MNSPSAMPISAGPASPPATSSTKSAFSARRPRSLATTIPSPSFPSGHVINYVGIYGTLAVIMANNVPFAPLRRLIVGAIGGKIALVGPSRIYLGHHWFTDVLTSYLLGSSYVIVLSSLYRRGRRKN